MKKIIKTNRSLERLAITMLCPITAMASTKEGT